MLLEIISHNDMYSTSSSFGYVPSQAQVLQSEQQESFHGNSRIQRALEWSCSLWQTVPIPNQVIEMTYYMDDWGGGGGAKREGVESGLSQTNFESRYFKRFCGINWINRPQCSKSIWVAQTSFPPYYDHETGLNDSLNFLPNSWLV